MEKELDIGRGNRSPEEGAEAEGELDPLKLVELRQRALFAADSSADSSADVPVVVSNQDIISSKGAAEPIVSSSKPPPKKDPRNHSSETDDLDLLRVVQGRCISNNNEKEITLVEHCTYEIKSKEEAHLKQQDNNNKEKTEIPAVSQPNLVRQTVITQQLEPGAYSGAPGEGLQRNSDLRFSTLGREAATSPGGGIGGDNDRPDDVMKQSEEGEASTPGGIVDDDRTHDMTNNQSEINDSSRMSVAIAIDDELDLQAAKKVEETMIGSETNESRRRKRTLGSVLRILLPVFCCIVLIAIVPVVVVRGIQKEEDHPQTSPPTMSPTLSMESFILSLLPDHTNEALMDDTNSSQYQALMWILDDPNLHEYPEWRVIQRYALMALFYSTSGKWWKNNTGWGNYSVHECDWYQQSDFARKSILKQFYDGFYRGFLEPLPSSQCNDDGVIQHLWVNQNNLVGSLAEEIFLLTSLKTLAAGANPELGDTQISSHIGNLVELQGLVLAGNRHIGSIPSEIGLLTSLEILSFHRNELDGSLPAEIWQLTNLDTLALGLNPNLQISIPSAVGNFQKLRWLTSSNSLKQSGSIPTEIGLASSLEWLVLYDINLAGTLPSQIGLLSNLLRLALWKNQMDGRLPTELGLLTSSTSLGLGDNSFSGTVPSEIGLLTSATNLRLDLNLLSGTIPIGLSNLSLLEHLRLENNQFTGFIPSEFGLFSSLAEFALSGNDLHGTVPDQLAILQKSLHTFRLEGNQLLSGTIPASLCNVNGTCVPNSIVECLPPFGFSFDCTDLLCGCSCPCPHMQPSNESAT